jgi:hypothetical protein
LCNVPGPVLQDAVIKCVYASLGLQCMDQHQKEAGDIDGFLPFPVAAKEVVNKK